MSNNEESILYTNALAFACQKYAGQVKLDGTPYILHPIKVSQLIKNAGYDIKHQIAGLFHDLLDKTDTVEADILPFGEEILETVKLMSVKYYTNDNQRIECILRNHMAAVVENANKILEIWDICDSKNESLQKEYLDDSRKYEEKFSNALDYSISRLEDRVNHYEDENERKYPDYRPEDMELAEDREKRYAEAKEKYLEWLIHESKTCEKPDRNDPRLEYAWGCLTKDEYYCYYRGTNKQWHFTEAGWIPSNVDLMYIYNYDLSGATREEILEEFRMRKEDGEMMDFVTEDDI